MTAGGVVRALTALEPKIKEAIADGIDSAESVTAGEIALTRGSVLRGVTGNVAAAHDAKTAGQILVGDGTDVVSVAVSGDATLASNGALTIAADAVTEQKMRIVIPVTISIPATLAVRGGSGLDGVMVGLITDTAAADVTQEDNSGASFVDETADAAEATANDVEIPDPFDTDDALYVGYTSKFFAVKIDMGTQGAGDAVSAELAYEYWDGSAWTALTEVIDDSAGFTAGTDTYVLSFLPPADWAATAVDSGTSMFFVRVRATANDVYNTTQPKITQLWVKPVDAGQGVPIPFDGTVSAATLAALTASATNNDTELLIVNITAGTFAHVTWTGGDAVDRITGLTLAATADDQIAVVVINEDGTTEFASVTAYLEVEVG